MRKKLASSLFILFLPITMTGCAFIETLGMSDAEKKVYNARRNAEKSCANVTLRGMATKNDIALELKSTGEKLSDYSLQGKLGLISEITYKDQYKVLDAELDVTYNQEHLGCMEYNTCTFLKYVDSKPVDFCSIQQQAYDKSKDAVLLFGRKVHGLAQSIENAETEACIALQKEVRKVLEPIRNSASVLTVEDVKCLHSAKLKAASPQQLDLSVCSQAVRMVDASINEAFGIKLAALGSKSDEEVKSLGKCRFNAVEPKTGARTGFCFPLNSEFCKQNAVDQGLPPLQPTAVLGPLPPSKR